ncbi:MAG: hypothetical protein JXA20_08155 [Spirochaetes bacterium]|nr:hypothetical protein [Spirochaetota bacterium]
MRYFRINLYLLAAFTVCLALLLPSCKEEHFPEPAQVFSRWSSALKNLNYGEYRQCEAFPKEEGVFRDMYRFTYYTDCAVREFEDLDRDDVKKNSKGERYLQRRVWFECAEVRRETGRQTQILRGEVSFIKYLSGDRTGDGWLMWNRSLYRMEP